ncbi:hypothetical protein LshimejAT787_2500590 [Lyophyllum shimeji]|uniref:Uncharacterized protein n=1 Tax=Lyophyllum shimeji TaxID=47721 RepID=A0A9P3PYZ1_LYOSH|nr:hypothetical protein LshimejAT787_2500590 [Lyophyllum shimeji]
MRAKNWLSLPSIDFTFTSRIKPDVSALKRPKGVISSTPTTSPTKKRIRTISDRPIIPTLSFSDPTSEVDDGQADDGLDSLTSVGFDTRDIDGSSDSEKSWAEDQSGESELSGDRGGEDDLSSCVKDQFSEESLEGATKSDAPTKANRKSLTLFWRVETQEEKEERVQRDFEKLRLDHEKRQQREERERQDQEEKIASGWVPGVKRKCAHPSLEGFNGNNEQSAAREVAENSRPCRQFKEDQRKKKKPCGRKRVNESTPALLTNWFQPAIWDQIEVAAHRAGKPWSPRLIVHEAQRLNPKCFAKLSEQVIGRWIDREPKAEGIYRWRASVLEHVRRGNAPGGERTRFGVLDAHPDVKNKIEAELTLLREASVPLTLITIRGIMVAIINKLVPELFTKNHQQDQMALESLELVFLAVLAFYLGR